MTPTWVMPLQPRFMAFLKALAEGQQAGGPVAAPKIHDDALHHEL